MRMKIAVACGGTGGHIFPGIATAEVLRKRGHDVELWLAGRDVEDISVSGWEGKVVSVKSAGFRMALTFSNLKALISLVKAYFKCKSMMKTDHRPDVLLAMGSYASVGPVMAASSLGIPVVIHESNAVPGRAVTFLAGRAKCVALGFRSASKYFRNVRTEYTGFPLRGKLGNGFESGLLRKGLFTVLVMGGSQGAHMLNEISLKAFKLLRSRGVDFQVVHLSGPRDEAMVKGFYSKEKIEGVCFGFLKEMANAYLAADIVISRAGAAACAEISSFGVPALFVPLPSAKRDHQKANAGEICQSGGADMVDEKDLSPEYLADYIQDCIKDSKKLKSMKEALNKTAVRDGTERLADLVLSMNK